MKKPIAMLAATGALALAALAGTGTTANAATAKPASGVLPVTFNYSWQCEQYVRDAGEWGIWDCEYVGGIIKQWMIFTP